MTLLFRRPQFATLLLLSWILLRSHSFQPPNCYRQQRAKSILLSPWTTVGTSCTSLAATPQPEQRSSRRHRRRLWKWCQRKAGPLAVAAAFARGQPAQARYSYEIVNQPTHSLRPGMSKTQAELLEEGALKASDIETKAVVVPDSTTTPTKTTKQSLDEYGDLDDDDDDDDDTILLENSRPVTQADKLVADQFQTKRQFAAYHQKKSSGLTIKVGMALFVPTYGSLIAREWFRRRREERYVQKGLEILEAQKAEYFNITTSEADSDVSDELKKLKKNETKAEDDDDDNDDDDEEEEDDQPPRKRRDLPRKPSGDGGSPSSSGGSDDKKDPGYGKPSNEDLDRLNKIFGKS